MSEPGPDFICVGMPKAGTGWLYDQLEAHPDFWMPPVKELVYLLSDYPPLPFVDEHGERTMRRRERRALELGLPLDDAKPRHGERVVHRFPLDARDTAFLKRAGEGKGKPMDLDFYGSLFAAKGDLLSGDITPPYCNLKDETIRRLATRFPACKIFLLVRDPVARTWSRICMSHEGKGFDASILQDAAEFRAYLEGTHRLGGLFATKVYEKWRSIAPDICFGVFFFDDIAASPEKARADILKFLCADPSKKSGDLLPGYNRKAKTKLEMPLLAREIMVEHFREELRASAEIFGGPARHWPKQYGL